MNFAVFGAGSIGCFIAAQLARIGQSVILVGRERQVEAIKGEGLHLRTLSVDQVVPVAITADPAAVATADAILVCVKSNDTAAAAASLQPHLRPGTWILSLQNGVDTASRLAKVLPTCEVVPSVVYVAAAMESANRVLSSGGDHVVLGPSSRSEEVAAVLRSCGLRAAVTPDVGAALWKKLIVNCAYNGLSAIAGLPYGALYPTPGMKELLHAVVDECLLVAAAEGVSIAPDAVHLAVDDVAQAMPAQYSSTAQDLSKGRPTEIDHLNGHLVALGRVHRLPTPLNLAIHSLVKLREAARA